MFRCLQLLHHYPQLATTHASALMSQTTRNPSIISFFIALANKRGSEHIDLEAFGQLWTSRIMTKHKHERFSCRVSESDPKYFEVRGDRSIVFAGCLKSFARLIQIFLVGDRQTI